MQLKIAQKILNLSFKDKSWMKLKIHPKILNIFEILNNFSFQSFEDPQNILRILTLKIFWGKTLQILNIEVGSSGSLRGPNWGLFLYQRVPH